VASGLARAWPTGSADGGETLLISGYRLGLGAELCCLGAVALDLPCCAAGSRPRLPGPRMVCRTQRPATGTRSQLADDGQGSAGLLPASEVPAVDPSCTSGVGTDDGERSKRPATCVVLLTPPCHKSQLHAALNRPLQARRRHREKQARITQGTNQTHRLMPAPQLQCPAKSMLTYATRHKMGVDVGGGMDPIPP
jgi:hypothetical protein